MLRTIVHGQTKLDDRGEAKDYIEKKQVFVGDNKHVHELIFKNNLHKQ